MSEFETMAKEQLTKLAAQPNGGGWVSVDNVDFAGLRANGLVETEGHPDADGDVYYTITDAGRAFIAPAPKLNVLSDAATEAFAKEYNRFDASDADWNQPRRRGAGLKKPKGTPLREQWGLDDMPVGASIHLAVTEQVSEPWKSYGSTIAGENKRWAKALTTEAPGRGLIPVTIARKVRGKDETKEYPVYEYSKYFVIFRAHENDPLGPGARIKRVDPVTKR